MKFDFKDIGKLKEEYIVNWINDAIASGVTDKGSPFHNFILGNVIANKDPELRVLTLRDFNPEEREIVFFTDYRSPKIKEFMENPYTSILFFNREHRVQLRIRGTVSINNKNVKTNSYWQKTPLSDRYYYIMREYYCNADFPLEEKYEVNYTKEESEAGYENFCVVVYRYHEIDFLTLYEDHHLHILYNWIKKTRIHQWISPQL